MYRVVQWATGSVGRATLRRVIDHPDLQLVGIYVYDSGKVGMDAGEIARRPLTGVRATNDIEQILALDADVVLHTSLISVPYQKQNADVQRLLASGKNVISLNGYFAPEVQGEAYAGPLRDAANKGGVTLAGIGLNPGFIGERVAVLMSGLASRLDAIRCYEVVDVSASPSPGLVFDAMGFGIDPAQEDITRSSIARMYDALYAETIHCVARSIGTSVESIAPAHEITLATADIHIAAGMIPRGTVAATTWRWTAQLVNGCAMSHTILWTSSHALHGETDGAHWKVEIDGRPHVRLSFDVHDPDPKIPSGRALMDVTAALLIGAIPDVCAAQPGFFRLPAPARF